MKVRMKKTLRNMKGEEFGKGEIVELFDCWINESCNIIYIAIRLNGFVMVTSIENIEYI